MNLNPPLPNYPVHIQLCRVTSVTVSGPLLGSSYVASVASLYVAYTQQLLPTTLQSRDREPCFVLNLTRTTLAAGYYLCRLSGSYNSLPVYEYANANESSTYEALSSTTITARAGSLLGQGIATLLTTVDNGDGTRSWVPTATQLAVYNDCAVIPVDWFLLVYREPISGVWMCIPKCSASKWYCMCPPGSGSGSSCTGQQCLNLNSVEYSQNITGGWVYLAGPFTLEADCLASCETGSWPKWYCVDDAGGGGGGAAACCPEGVTLPSVINATFTGVLSALGTVALTWNGSQWTGSGTACGGLVTIDLFKCSQIGPPPGPPLTYTDWTLTLTGAFVNTNPGFAYAELDCGPPVSAGPKTFSLGAGEAPGCPGSYTVTLAGA